MTVNSITLSLLTNHSSAQRPQQLVRKCNANTSYFHLFCQHTHAQTIKCSAREQIRNVKVHTSVSLSLCPSHKGCMASTLHCLCLLVPLRLPGAESRWAELRGSSDDVVHLCKCCLQASPGVCSIWKRCAQLCYGFLEVVWNRLFPSYGRWRYYPMSSDLYITTPNHTSSKR